MILVLFPVRDKLPLDVELYTHVPEDDRTYELPACTNVGDGILKDTVEFEILKDVELTEVFTVELPTDIPLAVNVPVMAALPVAAKDDELASVVTTQVEKLYAISLVLLIQY